MATIAPMLKQLGKECVPFVLSQGLVQVLSSANALRWRFVVIASECLVQTPCQLGSGTFAEFRLIASGLQNTAKVPEPSIVDLVS